MKRIALLAPLIMVGCASVPSTRISFDPVTHQVAIKSPKEIAISNLVIEVDGPKATIRIGSYASRNDAAVIAAIASQNAQTLEAAARIGGVVLGEAMKAAK